MKPEEKLNITRDNISDDNIMYTMTTRIMNSVQWFLRNIILITFQIFKYYLSLMHIAALLLGQLYICMTISDVSIYSFIYLNLIVFFSYHPHTLKLEIFLKPQKLGTASLTQVFTLIYNPTIMLLFCKFCHSCNNHLHQSGSLLLAF